VGLPVVLVLLLAFLFASFPARNSEVWRHLATGRALFAGEYRFGSDPFAYTTDGIVWVNHAWLFDALLYALYQIAGVYLVAAKGLLIVVLAALILLAAQPRYAPWTASFAVALALIAMAPFLALDSALVSYVCLALTLWLLQRSAPLGPHASLSYLPLAITIVVWANSDDWFLLGPAVIGCFAIAWAIEAARAGKQVGATVLIGMLLFVAALALCTVNPHHVRVFTLPRALTDVRVSPLHTLQSISWSAMPIPLAAYFLLVVLGALALVGNTSRRSLPWTLVWLALLGLSLYRTSAIPFFAVAAGPFLATAWQGARTRTVTRGVSILGHGLGTLAFLGLLVAACPGWLQGTSEPRGWFVRTDPSLRSMAEQIATWRRDGQLAEATRIFNLSPEGAHYVEFFCPHERVFLDDRIRLYPAEVVSDFQRIRESLITEPPMELPQAHMPAIREVLSRWSVTHVLVGDPAERPVAAALSNLWVTPGREWSAIAVEGRAILFAWTPPGTEQTPSHLPAIDFARRAYDPASASRAPRRGVPEPVPRPWWDCFVWKDDAATLDRDEALVDLAHFHAQRWHYLDRSRSLWEAEITSASLAAASPLPGNATIAAAWPIALLGTTRPNPDVTIPAPLAAQAGELIIAHQLRADEGPPGSLFLAIRAARRALAAQPSDPTIYLRLARAYLRLHHNTLERTAPREFPLLAELRRIQAIVALQRAVELRPDLVAAHELLAAVYRESDALDLALLHMQEQLRYARLAGPRPGEHAVEFAMRIDDMAAHEQQLGREVRTRINRVETESTGLDIYAKARLAQSRGLAGYATDLLQHRSVGYAEFGTEGARMQYHLLLFQGRTQVRDWLEPVQEARMGTFNYYWVRALADASTGDYDAVDEDLSRAGTANIVLSELDLPPVAPRPAMAFLVGKQVLRHAWMWEPSGDATEMLARLAHIAHLQHQQAELLTLRGLLALEAGGIESARGAFRASLAAWDGHDGPSRIARHYLGLTTPQ
jgi:hypothetical protein